mgnify:CR=1 FL=1
MALLTKNCVRGNRTNASNTVASPTPSGIAASRACTSFLDETRKRVQLLIEEAGGDLRLEFLDSDEEGAVDGDDEGRQAT